MKTVLQPTLIRRGFTSLIIGLWLSVSVLAQLPTASSIASQMKVGWNLGNTLEAICGETAWGNPTTTQTLINAVKAAGFNTVRLPVAWDCHSSNNVIDAAWIARVKAVVDYCINANVYVIINIHWDNGWLENNVTTSAQASVNAKQQAYWTQIANYFKSYNERVLFASANEPNVSDATGMSVLLSYHQTFINAVRATGGNNSSRTLIIQGPSTDIETTNNLMNTMPTDQIANRLMVEVHYYTPYQFCLMTADASWGNMFYYWGNGYHSTTETTRNATWGEESEVERLFGLMKSKFVDKGFPVLIGEFLAIKRTNPSNLTLHLASTRYFHKYVVSSAKSKGMIAVYWDTGGSDNALFNRSTGAVADQGTITAIMEGAGGNVSVTGVTLSPTTASLAVNGTTQLTATVAPSNATNKSVTWTSSSTGIATVNSSGLVTGVAAGSATITVTTVDGSKTATCAVTVTGTSSAATLTKQGSGSSSQTIALGTAITSFYYTWANATSATASGLPAGVTYTLNSTAKTITISGTPTVAGTFPFTVATTGGSPNATSGGTITVTGGSTSTLIYQGENAVINAGVTESTNGGYSGTGYANTNNATGMYVEWTVTTTTTGSFSIFFRYASVGSRPADIYVNGTKVISALAFPTTSAWTTWTNTATQTVTLINGTNKIRATATTSSGCANLDYLSVTGSGTLKSDVANNETVSSIMNQAVIYPNPVNHVLTISLPGLNKDIVASIYNSNGTLMARVVLNNTTTNIQTGDYKPGLYMVKLNFNNETITRKFIKK